jgi:hypothetical protein
MLFINQRTLKQDITNYFQPINYRNLAKTKICRDDKIFVSIASYRDPECHKTLHNLIQTAACPEKLVIVVCQQNAADDIDCLASLTDKRGAQINVITLPYSEAKGPCWARFLIQQQWRGEEYFLQLDSHMRFVPNWDTKCRAELAKCPAKTCLTNYLTDYDLLTGQPITQQLRGPMFISCYDWESGFFAYNSNYIDTLDQPTISNGYAACFSFASSVLIHDAPYDPYTPFLFIGEEIDIHARLFSRGWHTYVPSQTICYSITDRSYRKTFWEHPASKRVANLSRIRMRCKFGAQDFFHYSNLSPYIDALLQDTLPYELAPKVSFSNFLEQCINITTFPTRCVAWE